MCLAAALAIFGAAAAACSSDEEPAPPPYAGQGPGLPPLPPSGKPDPEQAELLSFAPEYLGNATLIADVGEPTEGPAWRDRDGALYFTVPSSANPLRRVVPGNPVEIVLYDGGSDAGVPEGGVHLLGLATGDGDRLYATEPEALVAIDFDDAGTIAATTRTEGPGGTSFGDITFVRSAFGSAFFFVDIASARTFRYTPDGGIEHVLTAPSDGRTATAIASREELGVERATVYVAMSKPFAVASIVSFSQTDDSGSWLGGAELANAGAALADGANGVTIDTSHRFFIASARGISTLSRLGELEIGQRALSVRIAAIPTCLTFGGADRKTLFVTTVAGKIYAIPVTTPGILR